MDDTSGAAPDNAPHDPTPEPSSSSSSSSSSSPLAPSPIAEHNPPASSRELEELRSDHGSSLEAHEKKISRLEGTVDLLLHIVDNVVRNRGAVHHAGHLDALELLLEEQRKNRPGVAEDLFTTAREELRNRATKANQAARG